ncbi:MAG: glycosyltransferase family 1 protein [Candidatus Electrothrix sp. AS4_5]|nr:glycosyltransferase family 1 protein [Candidatus Electrothrix gigas]
MSKTILIIANITNTHTHRFIREFKKRGWKVHVISIQPPNRDNLVEFEDSIIKLPTNILYNFLTKIPFLKYSEFHNINSGVKWYEPYSITSVFNYVYLLCFIKRIVKKNNPAGIFSIYLTMNGFLSVLTGHKKIVSSAAGGDISDHRFTSIKYWLNHPTFLRIATHNSYKVLGFDQNTFEPLFTRKKCRIDNIIWMQHWGVETDKFLPLIDNKKLDNEVCKFICSRPYRPQFDFESILLALKMLYQNNHHIQFIIASGAQSTENLEYLNKVLNETGCSGAEFITILNHIDYRELPNVIQKCDVYIDPINIHKFPETANWGVSGSLLEAMSCGLIPIISRRSGVDWILPPESNPFIYDNVEDGLLFALENAVASKKNKKIRMAMRHAVIEKANWNKNLDIIEDFYRT